MLSIANFFRRKDTLFSLAALLLLGVVAWSVYGGALAAPFIYDDPACITNNQSIVRLWPLAGSSEQPGPLNPPKDLPTSGRPLVNLTLALNYHFAKLDPAGYHLFNLGLHLLAVLLLGLIVWHTLRLEYFGGRFASASGPLAFLAALLWAVHPLNTETVVYVTQRTELMVGLFYLATLYGSLRYWGAESSVGRRSWMILTTLACLAGMACKEVMVTAPLVVLLFERTLISGSFRHALRKSWPLYVGLALGWLLLLLLNYNHPRAASAGFNMPISPLIWWFTQCKVLWMYLKLVVWPWPLLIHYQLPYLQTLGEAWPWLLATALLGIATLMLLWRRNAVGLIGAWVLLILSPTMVVPIVTEVAAERRMYLPLAALLTLVVVGGYWLLQQAGAKISATASRSTSIRRQPTSAVKAIWLITALSAALALAWSLVDVHRLAAYHDAATLWQETARSQPDDPVAYNNWGTELLNGGRPQDAIVPLQEALRIDPNHLEARINLGTALMKIGQMQEAMQQFQQVVQIRPNNVAGRCNLGIALGKIGRSQEAIKQLQMALKVDPGNASVHYNLGLVLGSAEQLPQAIEQFQRALQIDPDYFEARCNLGTALASLGQPEEAVKQFQQALQLRPSDCGAYFNLALTYEQMDRSGDALTMAHKALEFARAQGRFGMANNIETWLQDHRYIQANRPSGQ